MLNFHRNLKVFVALEPVDMQKQFDGLCGVAQERLGRGFSGSDPERHRNCKDRGRRKSQYSLTDPGASRCDDAGRVIREISAIGGTQPETVDEGGISFPKETGDRIVVEYQYSPDLMAFPNDPGPDELEFNSPRVVLAKYAGQIVGKSIHGYWIDETEEERIAKTIRFENPANPSGIYSDPLNLVSADYYYEGSGFSQNRIKRRENEDGSVSFFTYELASTELVTTIESGLPDAVGVSIYEGQELVNKSGLVGETIQEIVCPIQEGATLDSSPTTHMTYKDFDSRRRAETLVYFDDVAGATETSETFEFGCCGLSSHTNLEGSHSLYKYDAFRRPSRIVDANAVAHLTTYDVQGRLLERRRQPSGSEPMVLESFDYDLKGDLISHTNGVHEDGVPENNGVTVTTRGPGYTQNRWRTTTTNPDQGVRWVEYDRSGRMVAEGGDATNPKEWEYGVAELPWEDLMEPDVWEYTKEILLKDPGVDYRSEWVKRFYDGLGRMVAVAYPDDSYERYSYNEDGRLWRSVDADGVTTYYDYQEAGEVASPLVSGILESQVLAGPDRKFGASGAPMDYSEFQSDLSDILSDDTSIARTTREYFGNNSLGQLVHVVETGFYKSGVTNDYVVAAKSETSIDSLRSWDWVADDAGGFEQIGETMLAYPGAGERTEANFSADDTREVRTYLHGRLEEISLKDANGIELTFTKYGYDAHGRLMSEDDRRNGITLYEDYNDADLVGKITSPDPDGPELPGVPIVTEYVYDGALRLKKIKLSDASEIVRDYNKRGQLILTEGSQVFPVKYSYDPQGRMETMTTWKDKLGNIGQEETKWIYDSERGWLVEKQNPGEASPTVADFSYTNAGRLYVRNWERGVSITHEYHDNGLLKKKYSSDSSIPTENYEYTTRGFLKVVKHGASEVVNWSYRNDGLLEKETYGPGVDLFDGIEIMRGYEDQKLNSVDLTTSSSVSNTSVGSYSYDSTSKRLDLVTGVGSVNKFKYVPDSNLIKSVSFGDSEVRLRQSVFDRLNRSTLVVASFDGATLLSRKYGYDVLGRRDEVEAEDGSYWDYGYDALGQLEKAHRYWSEEESVAGQHFEFAYDDIGNRLTAKSGGDASGGALRMSAYVANADNGYQERTVPPYVEVFGVADSDAEVAVNGIIAERQHEQEYFRAELPVTNSTGPKRIEVQAIAKKALETGYNLDEGSVFLRESTASMQYDLDGNLTQDGRWNYVWNADNRLIQMTKRYPSIDIATQKLEFEYDTLGRRIVKRVYAGVNDTSAADTTLYVYDGWNLVGELDGNLDVNLNPKHTRRRTYVWGPDLSGSFQGAGGVGGLLAINQYDVSGENAETHNVVYDGNGNVIGLLKNNEEMTAVYEYGPFGELLRASGPIADENPFRFSTKYRDPESGLIYYGFRYYNPETGRWLSRDPIEEDGGPNLYGFVGNSPVNTVDPLGLQSMLYYHGLPGRPRSIPDFTPGPFAPGDALLGGPNSLEIDQRDWADRRYPGWVAAMEKFCLFAKRCGYLTF